MLSTGKMGEAARKTDAVVRKAANFKKDVPLFLKKILIYIVFMKGCYS
jgi:hypothetical protein